MRSKREIADELAGRARGMAAGEPGVDVAAWPDVDAWLARRGETRDALAPERRALARALSGWRPVLAETALTSILPGAILASGALSGFAGAGPARRVAGGLLVVAFLVGCAVHWRIWGARIRRILALAGTERRCARMSGTAVAIGERAIVVHERRGGRSIRRDYVAGRCSVHASRCGDDGHVALRLRARGRKDVVEWLPSSAREAAERFAAAAAA